MTAMKAQERPYVEIIDRDGRLMHAIYHGCERYPREVELDMLEQGYTVKVNGKKLIKKELKGNETI